MAYTYCSYADVVERLELADIGFPTATYTSATIAPNQLSAEQLIYGKLNGYVKVDLFSTTVPLIITELCADLAAYMVCSIVLGLDYFRIPDTIKSRKKNVATKIEEMRNGEIYLGSSFEIAYEDYFVGNSTKCFDFSTCTTSWFDIQ